MRNKRKRVYECEGKNPFQITIKATVIADNIKESQEYMKKEHNVNNAKCLWKRTE